MDKFTKISKLGDLFSMDELSTYKLLLNSSNKYGVKILAEVSGSTIINTRLYDSILKIRQELIEAIPSIDEIKHNAKSVIPFDLNSYVYFLLDDSDTVIYIGQSTAIAQRIGSHVVNGKKFNRVSLFPVESDHLLSIEGACISYYKPPLNIAIPLKEDALTGILKELLRSYG